MRYVLAALGSAALIIRAVPGSSASLSTLLPIRWLTGKWTVPRKAAGTAAT